MSLLNSIRGKSKSEEGGQAPPEQLSISDQMEALKSLGGNSDELKSKVVDVLTDPDLIQYTAMLTESQLREIQNLQILNTEYFGNSPLLNSVIDLQMNLSVSRDGYGRKGFFKLAQVMASDMEQLNKLKANHG